MDNIFHLNQKNIDTYDNSARNVVVHSKLNQYSSFNDNARLSVKYVNSGTEHYRVNNKRYSLNAGEFLLVKENSELAIEFDSKNEAEGFCFFIDENYVKQVLLLNQENNTDLLPTDKIESIDYHFLDTKYRSKDSNFGKYLSHIVSALKMRTIRTTSEDFFLNFTEHLLSHQYGVTRTLNTIDAIKRSTKEELFKRAQLAKAYLDDHLEMKISIQTLSQIAGLSEVQLHRCFKKLYQQTPHQYQTKTKMEQSLVLIRSGLYDLTEIGLMCGFTDLPTFSKSFKRYFGEPPSSCLNF